MADTWEEIRHKQAVKLWQQAWEFASDEENIADLRDDHFDVRVEARVVLGLITVRVREGDETHFVISAKSMSEGEVKTKAMNEFSDAVTTAEDAEFEAKHYQSIYLPREAEGVSEWR